MKIRTLWYKSKSEDKEARRYKCPKGHTFVTSNPIIIAVDDDPDYNSGPVCSYCYVDWFKVNVNADEDIPF